MEVRLARTAGFCFGVERAVNAVYEALDKYADIYTYGPVIHNETVVAELKARGVRIIDSFEELCRMCADGSLKRASVIIRAHGIGIEAENVLRDPVNEINVIDATCPLVKKVQDKARESYVKGDRIIIAGRASHPEVAGILSRINNDALVIENVEETWVTELDSESRYTLLAQTTFNIQKFKDIVEFLKKKIYYVNVVNTICNATELRQKEAFELSRECDLMIVIGSRNSSNTAKLYDICRENCSRAQYIGSLADFDDGNMSSVNCVGITAGASTPYSIIEEVLKHVRNEF